MKQIVVIKGTGTGGINGPRSIEVSLPVIPGVDITQDRPETAPRCRIVTPQNKLTSGEFVETIRREWIKARKDDFA